MDMHRSALVYIYIDIIICKGKRVIRFQCELKYMCDFCELSWLFFSSSIACAYPLLSLRPNMRGSTTKKPKVGHQVHDWEMDIAPQHDWEMDIAPRHDDDGTVIDEEREGAKALKLLLEQYIKKDMFVTEFCILCCSLVRGGLKGPAKMFAKAPGKPTGHYQRLMILC